MGFQYSQYLIDVNFVLIYFIYECISFNAIKS